MLFVHGTGGGRAVMGDTPAVLCEACGQVAPRAGVVNFRYWHLWYLFSFLTGREYQTVCRACGAIAPMDKAEAKIQFPKDNIPFIRKRGWMLCLGAAFVLLFGVALGNQRNAERLREMLAAPAVGDAYQADLSKVRGSGYAYGGDTMYGAMILVEKQDDGRFVVATSDTAFERKADLRKEMKDDLQYSVSYNDDEEPLTLSQPELVKLEADGILYEGERGTAVNTEAEEAGEPEEADAETVAAVN